QTWETMVIFRDDEDKPIGAIDGHREFAVLEGFAGVIMRMGIFRMSINLVSMSLRFDTSPKTKLAAGSVKRPCRGVPIMIVRKTGRGTPCEAMFLVCRHNLGKLTVSARAKSF